MKAVRIHEHGGPDVLQVDDISIPEVETGQVLVKIKAVALNHLDIFVRRGMAGMNLPLPMILGSDISGVVEKVGSKVDESLVGQRVLLNPGISCGRCPYCVDGEASLCDNYHLLGESGNGGYCEYISVPAQNAFPLPESATFEEGAAFPLVFITAWRMMVNRAQVGPTEDVLILGGGAGVGMAAIQICKLLGARVIATASTEEKLAKLRELGVDDCINYVEEPNFHRNIRKLTGGKGADVAVDYIGKDTWVRSLKSLRKGGRLVTCGATTGFDPVTDLRHVFFRQLSILGSTMGSGNDLARALKCWKQGKVKPVIHEVLPLEQAANGHRLLEERKAFGKVVLKVSD